VNTASIPSSPDSESVAGVQRINRLPLVTTTVICVIIAAALFVAFYQRHQQTAEEAGVGLGGQVDPVVPEQVAQELFRNYQEDPAPFAEMADLPQSLEPEHHAPSLQHTDPPDPFSEEQNRLAYDATLAPTTVPMGELYRSSEGAITAQTSDLGALNAPTITPAAMFPGDTADPNLRERKDLFKRTKRHYGYSSEPRRPAISPYILRVGSLIPAVLIGGINSDLPGEVLAQVSHDVRDSRSGRHVLIPRGSKLVGIYDHHVAMGQKRVMTVWHRIQFPDDSTLDLDGMVGLDQAGYAGFNDRVDNHFLRIFGNATLLSMLGAGAQLAIPQSGADENLTAQEIIASETARQWGEVGREMVRRNLKIQPTLEIRPGYRFNVIVDKDLILPPYTG